MMFFLCKLRSVTFLIWFPNFQVHFRKIFEAILHFFFFVNCFQSLLSLCFLNIKVSSREIHGTMFEKIFPSVD